MHQIIGGIKIQNQCLYTTQQIVPEELHERQRQQNDLPCFQTGTAWDYWQGYLLYKELFETAYHDEAYYDH